MKKGFTLIELLAFIALLGAIIAISVPTIMNNINNNGEKMDKQLYETVYAAANLYVQNNPKKFNDNSTHHIKLRTLVDEELLDESIMDKFSEYCVMASYGSNRYQFDIEQTCVEG